MSSDQPPPGPHEATPVGQGPKTSARQVIAPDGDLILFTPGANLGTEADPTTGDASFLVSSTHLKLASRYFKTLLSARWSGAPAPTAGSHKEIAIIDCNPHVLGMMMNIIHGRTRALPKSMTLGELAQFAVAADFFQCSEAVELAAKLWMGPLKLHVPSYWTPAIPTWIMVARVFYDHEVLSKALKAATEDGPSDFPTNGLPIPLHIKGMSTSTTLS